ncbi:MAG: hypothetical protein WB586_13505 [Chthoniobacterales bacterium]
MSRSLVAEQSLFTNDVLCLIVGSQSQEDRLTQLFVAGPLGELDLGYQHRLDPHTVFHNRRRDPLAPAPWSFLWQFYKRAWLAFDLLHALVQLRQDPFGEAGADSAGEKKPSRTVLTDQRSAEVFAAAFGRRVAPITNSCCWVSLTLTQVRMMMPGPSQLVAGVSTPSAMLTRKSMAFILCALQP